MSKQHAYWVPHVSSTWLTEEGQEPRLRHIVQMRVPRALNHGSPLIALSDYTADRDQANTEMQRLRQFAGEYLRDLVHRPDHVSFARYSAPREEPD